MPKFTPIKEIKTKKGIFNSFKNFAAKIGGTLELLIILFIWIIIFSGDKILGGFSKDEIITYIIFGNIISIFMGYFLHRIIMNDLIGKESNLLIYKPIRYLYHIILKGIGKITIPFFIALLFQVIILYFFLDNLILNFDLIVILLIVVMIILAFITEFLIAYLININIFSVLESENLYKIALRFKKIISGNYFPLTILPIYFVSLSLVLPFAYSFFVPMELYLKKMTIGEGFRGLIIQILWIILLYILIKLSWKNKIKKQAIKQGE